MSESASSDESTELSLIDISDEPDLSCQVVNLGLGFNRDGDDPNKEEFYIECSDSSQSSSSSDQMVPSNCLLPDTVEDYIFFDQAEVCVHKGASPASLITLHSDASESDGEDSYSETSHQKSNSIYSSSDFVGESFDQSNFDHISYEQFQSNTPAIKDTSFDPSKELNIPGKGVESFEESSQICMPNDDSHELSEKIDKMSFSKAFEINNEEATLYLDTALSEQSKQVNESRRIASAESFKSTNLEGNSSSSEKQKPKRRRRARRRKSACLDKSADTTSVSSLALASPSQNDDHNKYQVRDALSTGPHFSVKVDNKKNISCSAKASAAKGRTQIPNMPSPRQHQKQSLVLYDPARDYQNLADQTVLQSGKPGDKSSYSDLTAGSVPCKEMKRQRPRHRQRSRGEKYPSTFNSDIKMYQQSEQRRQCLGAQGQTRSRQGKHRPASESDAHVRPPKIRHKSEAAMPTLETKSERKSKSRCRMKKPACQVNKEKLGARVHPDLFMENEDHVSLLTELASTIEGKKIECESEVEKIKVDLNKKMPKKRKKLAYVPESVIVMRKDIEKSIEESEHCKESFFAFCNGLKEDINEQILSTNSSLALEAHKILEKKIQRECFKYAKALPIYARRCEILRVINSRQTCILIGETGSGKSTQLVQYLYEEGYAEHGLIACTQPRKLAARSLAMHVSREVGEKNGQTYAYFGTESRWKGKPKVVFMTDHTLLNECIADRRLSKYTAIVIDEAHERSIHTDILIALIKRCLPERQDLRVIVTSATINPKSFSDYFGGWDNCPVITVPGRVFPVDVFWEKSKVALRDRNYVNETVMKAHDIHIENKGKEGDILVFLTSPVEIEQACKLAKETMKNEVVVLPLHGKLQPEEQQIVFEATPGGKRKVVFSTNVAETSVTIPGIKYVIDRGLSKEMGYDPQRNMNSLEIRHISQSSADQRKGRAGWTGPGECHRLFSEHEYESMRSESTPEILRIALSFAIIKLYEFGIDDIHSFEYVDAPDKKALDDAVENLKFHGAIAEGKLTQLGKKMAFLPVEPNLSRVLLDSVEKGIGSVGTAVVAISSLAGQVFFRPSQDELKEESDHKQMPSCQDSGDQMTNIHAYFEWSKQPKSSRSSWCRDHYVNGKSMRMVEELIRELVTLLKQKCRINVSPSLNSLDNADEVLPKLFFDAFLKNLSVHSGHDKIGYWCENLPTQQMVVHYGSSLQYLGFRPKYVIFEKSQKTSQNFMLQVLPVKEEWIKEALEKGKLQFHPLEAPLYSFYCVSCLVISNLGPTVIGRLRKKYHSDRRNPVSEFRNQEVRPLFEYSNEHGELKIIAQETYHDVIKESVLELVEEVKSSLKSEEHEDGIVGANDDVRIIMGEGVLKNVLMPHQFQGIRINGVHWKLTEKAVEEIQTYGECKVEYGKTNTDGTLSIFVKFLKPEEALQALKHTFQDFDDPSVFIQRLLPKNRNDFRLKIKWARRERESYAFINFSDDEYEFVMETCDFMFPVVDKSSGLRFELYHERKSMKISRLQDHMDAEYIKNRLLQHVPVLSKLLENANIRFIFGQFFEETREMYLQQKNELNDELLDIVPRGKYYMDFLFPKSSKATYYVAHIHFDDSQDCENVKENLPSFHYKAEMSLFFSLRYTPHVFSVIQPSVKAISDSFPGLITYDKKDHWGNVFVRISAKDLTSFIDCRDAVTKSVEPLEIKFGQKQGKYSTTTIFIKHIRKIERDTKTVIKWESLNVTNDTIMIYGTEEKKQLSRDKILEHLSENLSSDISFFEIDLKLYIPGTMKQLVLKYGRDAEKLAEDFDGIKATKLDSRNHVLLVFSTDESYDLVMQYLESYKIVSGSVPLAINCADESSHIRQCCVCFEAHDLNTTFHRLECCGHVYCKECIKAQLDHLSITFPVASVTENCEHNFVWKDFEALIKGKIIQLQDIKSSSLKHFVSQNSAVYHHCTTPDCDMVYIITETGERFVCSQCGANICTRCHCKWHDGYDSCGAYQRRNDKDTVVEDWMKEDQSNRKNCPSCGVAIEKNKGCREVTCIKCCAKICWMCLEYFKTSDECHDHLVEYHGGIFNYNL